MIKGKVTTIDDKYTHENYSINPITPRNISNNSLQNL